VTGAVTVENITGGGVFTPAPAPVLSPVGIWRMRGTWVAPATQALRS
jgi:hypothetical protein